jgi:hypothetical protein
MSAPITESHRELAQSIAEAQRGYTEQPDEAAELIADSEARAVEAADFALQQERNIHVTTIAERDQLRADCENETKWAAHYLADAQNARARADRAEAELLIAQRLLIDSEDAGTVAENLRAELAAERARLDWLEKQDGGFCHVKWGEYRNYWGPAFPTKLRAAIDAEMKEDK